ncbi:MAG: hypothetical protein LC104_20705, partial [Bacteroidales bacterium]|nr:hypothetical protein [Bacteroidales bacterium]
MKFVLFLLACAVFVGMTSDACAAEKRPMTLDDLFQLKRIGDPQIAPNGQQVAYTVGTVDMAANKTITAIWVAATDGQSPPRQLTNSGKRDAHPRWSPDGTKILFESNRSGSSQLWVLDLVRGGEATQVTDIATDASGGIWSPDGQRIAFVSAVCPEFSELPFAESNAKSKERNEQAEKNPVKARVFTKLFFRHWDSYVEGKRQHLFVCDANGQNCRDVTPGDRDANPTSMTFSSSVDYTFTPDSRHLVFTAVPAHGEAWTTNYDLCRVRVDNPSTQWDTLTATNPAADSGPQFSPDGKKLAWRAQKQAGYEADKWDILTVHVQPDGTWTGEPKNLTAEKDWSAGEFCWLSNSEVLFSADQDAATVVARVATDTAAIHTVLTGGRIGNLTATPGQPARITFSWARMDAPAEVYSDIVATGGLGKARALNLSQANDSLLSRIDRPRPESVKVPVEGGVEMQMWILKPPGFDPSKKWPVAYLVHG